MTSFRPFLLTLALSTLYFSGLASPLAQADSMPSVERIGVYTGSFDPPHSGHVKVAAGMKEKFNLDRVYIVPDMNMSYKKLSAYPLREKLARMVFEKTDGLKVIPRRLNGAKFELWDFPQQVRKLHPNAKLFAIVGADTYNWLRTQTPPLRFKP